MKKLISLILSAVLTFSVIPNMEVKAASIKEQAGKAYADIIQNYLDASENKKNNPEYYWSNTPPNTINPEFVRYCDGYNAIYRIMDFNNDGAPELFVGLKDSNTYNIYDVYTFYNGKAVRLIKEDIGDRMGTCILCKNGIIEDNESGGAYDYDTRFHKLPKNKNKLKEVMKLASEGYYDNKDAEYKSKYSKTVNGKKSKISKKKCSELYKRYSKRIKVTFYKADRQAISIIREGVFNYPSQKKWKLKSWKGKFF